MLIQDKDGLTVSQRPQVIKFNDTLAVATDNLGGVEIGIASDFTLTNATTDNTISVDQNGNVGTNVATDGAIHIENTGNTGIGLGVYTNIASVASPLVQFSVANASNTGAALRVTHAVTRGIGIQIGTEGETPVLRFGDGINVWGNSGSLRIQPLFTGKLLQLYDSTLTLRVSINFDTANINLSAATGAVFTLPADATDPTGGGGAALGRIPVTINSVTRYIPYY